MPPSFLTADPVMYQGGSDDFIGPRDDIVAASEELGVDLEAEVIVVTGDVSAGRQRTRRLGTYPAAWLGQATSRCARWWCPNWPRASASSSPGRPPRCLRCLSRQTSWATIGAAASCTG